MFRPPPTHGSERAFVAHLAAWLGRLPKPCGIFAANDEVAEKVVASCRRVRPLLYCYTKLPRGYLEMTISTPGRIGSGVGCALVLAVALTASLARAETVAVFAKSYFVDPRKPVVALSNPVRLNTTAVGMYILVR